ncbi:cytochrome c maturation protein CcmE [Aquicella lusitana]|jgi:Cytochrome c-type biogenesis protein CcmE|uniref:Cytochrome c-type biogenesis protein CcmE n=1 Tax=Aquicella lusitana TaxID=254246 RepID=A0A370G8T2_9COXI|nr:cytochrome c maturation protein CcmE [Aquicella lusitana]RDI40177.1 cytochrome c-type biogenesis protein CcmE [Aquicella lusitana]VVC72432.1 Cytochrome c-type biogenesis protein CcmE [Aquicella lusitana]
MNKIHQRRIVYVLLFSAGLALATGLILYALKQNINAFLTPSQITSAQVSTRAYFRLGGMVKKGSVQRDKTGLGVQFTVTDLKREQTVRYVGVLPDLFREGKGVIAEGTLDPQGIFVASRVLAKHDENYMPKNVYKAMRENAV